MPKDTNHIELQVFLKDKLLSLGVLVFDVRKYRAHNGQSYAILTVPDTIKGNTFLQYYGSRGRQVPLVSLVFQGQPLTFRVNNKPGQPDPLKIRTLQEKEASMRAKMGSQAPVAHISRAGRSTLPFQTLMTGVWDYDDLDRLAFDQKYKDKRQGYVTFGKSSLVLYLQEGIAEAYNWHCRIDVPYAIVEHVIPSFDDGKHGTITFTLKSPPKFYSIRSTDDLHLYAGGEAPQHSNGLPDFASLSLGPKQKAHRLERLCSLNTKNTKNSALCMVYKVAFFDKQTVQHAYNFVKDFSVPQIHCWKTMVPKHKSHRIETECEVVENRLSTYGPSIPLAFDFAVRYQLAALMLEGTIAPMKMIELIPYVHSIAKQHGAEFTATAVRRLAQQVPTPAPYTEAKSFKIQTLVVILQDAIRDCKSREMASHDLSGKQKKHHHLALTYKATVTPTGMYRSTILYIQDVSLITSSRYTSSRTRLGRVQPRPPEIRYTYRVFYESLFRRRRRAFRFPRPASFSRSGL